MAESATGNTHRPWIDHYPDGISWDIPIDTTPVHEQLLAMCARQPDAVALDFLGATTKFGALGEAVNAFAGALQSQFGITKGHRVALMLPNTPFYVIAYYGVLRAGGTVVNCNPLYTVPELGHIVGNAKADVMITLDLEQLFSKAAELVRQGHAQKLIVCHFPSALPPVKRVLYTIAKRKDLADVRNAAVAGKVTWFHHMLARKDKPAAVTIDAVNDVAVQQYTGGTTGLPKGAMLSHANIAANLSQIDAWGCGLFNPPTKVLAVLPFFHIFAMTACMNVPLTSGAQLVILPRFELKPFLSALARTRPNVLFAVPTLLNALTRVNAEGRHILECLEVVVSGGASLPNEVRDAFSKVAPKAIVAEGYGLTEASPVVCCSPLRARSKPLSIGQPLPGTDIRLIDIETGKPAEAGQRGELQVKGPQVMIGYFGQQGRDGDTFIDGWLRTGDVCTIDEDGFVFLVDRIKDLIICSGFNVYPRVIEEALAGHPAVEECNVIGVPDTYRGEAPVAYVKLREGQSVTEQDLKKFLGSIINKLEMPREIIFRESLPKTLIGKLSKKDLREDYKSAKADHSEPA